MTSATELTEADREVIREARDKSPANLQAQIASLTAENERLRFALNQMMPDYEGFIEDAVYHGADETWVEECWQIAAYARAALQPKEGNP